MVAVPSGTQKLIDKVLGGKKPVLIAIRETVISEEDPYTVEERREMIRVVVAVIAPFRETRAKIDEICQPYWIYIRGGECRCGY